ncbi:hypothetical protein AAVH_36018, partial [Aphelenchoides avenae]
TLTARNEQAHPSFVRLRTLRRLLRSMGRHGNVPWNGLRRYGRHGRIRRRMAPAHDGLRRHGRIPGNGLRRHGRNGRLRHGNGRLPGHGLRH